MHMFFRVLCLLSLFGISQFYFPNSMVFGQFSPIPSVELELEGSVSDGDHAPFWFTSNSFGKHRLYKNSAIVSLKLSSDRAYTHENMQIQYGLELTQRLAHENQLWLHQGWISADFFRLVRLRAGLKEETLGNEFTPLSSGSVIWSGNARPMPKIEVGTPGYVDVPFSQGKLQVKGSLAHGWFEQGRFNENVWLHQKYAGIRTAFDFPLNFTFTFHHFAMWGGVHPTFGQLPNDLESFFKVFFVRKGDEDAPMSWQENRFGNHLGSRNYGLDWTREKANWKFYFQDVYEDGSGGRMENFPDGLWGIVYQNKNTTAPLAAVLYEYLQTTDQSGPVHDNELSLRGDDNYFNHGIYRSGWTHHKQTIGTPFITSPLYNQHIDHPGNIRIWNNRVKVHHIGLMGTLMPQLSYKLLVSYSENRGVFASTITLPAVFAFEKPLYQWSALFRIDYSVPAARMGLGLALAADKGKMYGNNVGMMLTARYMPFGSL